MAEIYLDNQASTPCDPAVVEAMLPYLLHEFANPSSPHRAGIRVRRAIDRAREQIAESIGAAPGEIFFTSGATESNNLAICGTALVPSKRTGLVTSAIEHKSVLACCAALAQRDHKLAICPVRPDGQVDLAAISELINESTRLVSLQLANNEIGTIQPVLEVGQLAHRHGALFHVDAAQAFGKIPVNVDELEVDFLSLSAHKCYGPKGVGALYVRRGVASQAVSPLILGGGQEMGLRAGTPNVPGAVGFGEAASICVGRLDSEPMRIAALRDQLESNIQEKTMASVNGARARRLPGSSSLTFRDADADAVIANLPEVALSSSSACNAGALEPSHVLLAIGLDRDRAYQTIRVGIGRFSTKADITRTSELVIEAVNRIERPG